MVQKAGFAQVLDPIASLIYGAPITRILYPIPQPWWIILKVNTSYRLYQAPPPSTPSWPVTTKPINMVKQPKMTAIRNSMITKYVRTPSVQAICEKHAPIPILYEARQGNHKHSKSNQEWDLEKILTSCGVLFSTIIWYGFFL